MRPFPSALPRDLLEQVEGLQLVDVAIDRRFRALEDGGELFGVPRPGRILEEALSDQSVPEALLGRPLPGTRVVVLREVADPSEELRQHLVGVLVTGVSGVRYRRASSKGIRAGPSSGTQ